MKLERTDANKPMTSPLSKSMKASRIRTSFHRLKAFNFLIRKRPSSNSINKITEKPTALISANGVPA
jgi:hypothetical protein